MRRSPTQRTGCRLMGDRNQDRLLKVDHWRGLSLQMLELQQEGSRDAHLQAANSLKVQTLLHNSQKSLLFTLSILVSFPPTMLLISLRAKIVSQKQYSSVTLPFGHPAGSLVEVKRGCVTHATAFSRNQSRLQSVRAHMLQINNIHILLHLVNHLGQWSPTTGPRTGTSPWINWYSCHTF